VQAAVAAGEDVVVVVAVEVGAQQLDEEWRQEDVAHGGGGLRRAEFEVAADFV